MNSLTVSGSAAKDIPVSPYYIDFYSAGNEGSYKIAANRDVEKIVRVLGANYSYVQARIPLKRMHKAGQYDHPFGNAGRADGAGGQIKLLSRYSSGYQENVAGSSGGIKQPLLNGWIVKIGHHLRLDTVLPFGVCDRWLLMRMILFGRQVWIRDEGVLDFVTNPDEPLIFNMKGPDCIDTPYGPAFAQGYRVGNVSVQEESPSSGVAYDTGAPGVLSGKVRFWRVTDILSYIRRVVYSKLFRPDKDYGCVEIPEAFLKWPKELGSNIQPEHNRTPIALNLDAVNVLDGLELALKKAGMNYTLSCEPVNAIQSVLGVENRALKRGAGACVFSAEYIGNDVGVLMNNPSVAWDGVFEEDAMDTCAGGSASIGDAPAVEAMLSTYGGQDDWEKAGGLSRAYGTAEIAKYQADIDGYANQTDPPQYNEQSSEYANNRNLAAFNFFKINTKTKPFAGTIWADWLTKGLLRFKTHQLSAFNEQENNPLGLVHRELIVEYRIPDEQWTTLSVDEQAKGRWRFHGKFTALQLSQDARIVMIPDVRAAGHSFYCIDPSDNNAYNSSIYGGKGLNNGTLRFKPRDIRIQCVVEHNYAMVARSGKNDTDTTGTLHRIDPKAPKFVYQQRTYGKQYVHWTRTNNSAPIGMAGLLSFKRAQVRAQFPYKVLFDDRDRLQFHADINAENWKRVFYKGSFVIHRPTATYRPGMGIQYINSSPISNVSGVIDCIVHAGQTTTISFGPGSPSPLYDQPKDYSNVASTGTVAAGGYGGGGDSKYDNYDNGKSNTGGSGGSGSGGDYDRKGAQGGPEKGITSDNDDPYETNNQAVKNNPTADKSGQKNPLDNVDMDAAGKRMQAAKVENDKKQQKPMTKGEQAASRAENAKKMAADERAKGNEKKAAKIEKDARRLATRAENQKGLEAGKADQRANRGSMTLADGTVIGAGQLGDAMFGKSLEGGGFTMHGGKKQVRAGDLGKDMGAPNTYVNGKAMDLMGGSGAGGMFDTSKADAHDKKTYSANKAVENERIRKSWDKFASTKGAWGGKGAAKPAAKPAAGPAAAKPAARGNAPANNFMNPTKIQRAPRKEDIVDE
jgi:hypothetical protein